MTDHDRDDWPSPGPNEPIPTWDEYDQLKEAVHDYLDHDPDEPGFSNIWRALGAILVSPNGMPSPPLTTLLARQRRLV